MEEKIKYVLNGETKYYTYEELKAYLTQLQKSSGVYFENDIENDVRRLIKRLKKYDGDPYGNLSKKESRRVHHEIEARGFLYVVR